MIFSLILSDCCISHWNVVFSSCVNSSYHVQVLDELITASYDDACVKTAAMLDKAHLLYKTVSCDSHPQ